MKLSELIKRLKQLQDKYTVYQGKGVKVLEDPEVVFADHTYDTYNIVNIVEEDEAYYNKYFECFDDGKNSFVVAKDKIIRLTRGLS